MSSESSVREQVLALNDGQRAKLAALLKDRSRRRLVAFVQTSDAEKHRDWKSELSDRLPRHMIPISVTAVERLPRLPNGKVDRSAINAIALPTKNESASIGLSSETQQERAGDGPNKTENTLLSIWQDVLGFEEITLEDEFFEIGGDSLLSIQLLSRANTAGLDLLPSDLIEEVSIRRLSRISHERRTAGIDREIQSDTTSSSGDSESEPKSVEVSSRPSLVQKIHSGTGLGSVMLTHDIGGDIGYAKHLIEPFTKHCNLYVARQSQSEDAADTVQEMAASILEEWTSHDPKEPFFLVAYCWGALIAYEMSRQLLASGRPVGGLLVIESKMEGAFRFATPAQRAVARSRGVLHSTRDRLTDLARARSVDGLKKAVPGRIRSKFRAAISSVAVSEQSSWQPSERNVNAYYGYQPEPADIPVHLFRVRNQIQSHGGSYVDDSYGWKHLVQNNLQTHWIPGEHHTCTQLPHAKVLSNKINELVEQAARDDA